MKFVTFRRKADVTGSYHLGVVLPDGDQPLVLDISVYSGLAASGTVKHDHVVATDMISLLRSGESGLKAVRDLVDQFLDAGSSSDLHHWRQTGLEVPLSQLILAPPVPRPGKIISMGMNFADHVSEGSAVTPEIPEFPMAFIKFSTTLIGHDQPILLPRRSQEIDYEVELAVVIGQKCKEVQEEDALDHVAGYCVFNDISARDIQFREMKKGLLTMGKNFDTFGPLGPWLVTRDEIPDPGSLELGLRLNGEVRQHSNTHHMIYSVPVLIAYWSALTLEPGDIITCGTPSGVAAFRKPDPAPYYLKPGDVVEAWVEGVGTLRNPVMDA